MSWKRLRQTVLLGATVGLLLPATLAVAQSAGDRAREKADAAEIVRLLGEGHISLRDAIAVAEKHTSGVALNARARLVSPKPAAERPADSTLAQPTSRQLLYRVECFDKGKLLAVEVDAQTRQVTEVKPMKERPKTDPAKP